MQFLKTNIFGILSVLVGLGLLYNTISRINEIQDFNEFTEVGEYISIEKKVKTSEDFKPGLMSGGIKTSLIFLLFLLIPVVLAIVHKRVKAGNKILYLALTVVVVNFLVFPYLLTLLYNIINSN